MGYFRVTEPGRLEQSPFALRFRTVRFGARRRVPHLGRKRIGKRPHLGVDFPGGGGYLAWRGRAGFGDRWSNAGGQKGFGAWLRRFRQAWQGNRI
jgi:hypothetical protein